MKDADTQRQVMVQFNTPKTEAGNRDIVLPRTVSNALRKHCRHYVADGPDSLIVTTTTGEQMLDTTIRNRLAPVKKAAGRPDIRRTTAGGSTGRNSSPKAHLIASRVRQAAANLADPFA